MKAARGAGRVAHDQDALEQRVRVAQQQLAILERSRLGLVGVDDDVARLGGGQEARLAAGGEAGAAAAAQARGRDGLDDLLARHRLDGALELRVAAVLLVVGEIAAIAVERQQERALGRGSGAVDRPFTT